MLGGRKVRSNKGKKRGPYGPRTRKTIRHSSGRKVRSNKGKKRTPYGPRTGKTRSGRRFRGGRDNGYTTQNQGFSLDGGPVGDGGIGKSAISQVTVQQQSAKKDPEKQSLIDRINEIDITKKPNGSDFSPSFLDAHVFCENDFIDVIKELRNKEGCDWKKAETLLNKTIKCRKEDKVKCPKECP